MSQTDKYLQKAQDIANQCAEELGLEIESVKFLTKEEGLVLEIIADTEFGLQMDDAVALNERISFRLDEEDFIEEEYFLEVSSIGAERKLKTTREKQAAVGRFIQVNLKDKSKIAYLLGTLETYNDQTLLLKINEKGKITRKEISLEEIEFINLAIKF